MPRSARRSPAAEAWVLMSRLVHDSRHRFFAIVGELDLSPAQAQALLSLEEDEPIPMSGLAGVLRCDNSNVTGIVDRLESRELVERRPASHDRRIKHLHLTEEGARVRALLEERLSAPPEPLRRLGAADQRALRDLLRRALEDEL